MGFVEHGQCALTFCLTLILPMWRLWWAPNIASRWQIEFNSAFKGLTNWSVRDINRTISKSSSWYLYAVPTINTDNDVTVLILFHLLSYTHCPKKPCVLVHNLYAWLVLYRCPSSLFCSLQLAANSHQGVMLFQVWDFWKRNINILTDSPHVYSTSQNKNA